MPVRVGLLCACGPPPRGVDDVNVRWQVFQVMSFVEIIWRGVTVEGGGDSGRETVSRGCAKIELDSGVFGECQGESRRGAVAFADIEYAQAIDVTVDAIHSRKVG